MTSTLLYFTTSTQKVTSHPYECLTAQIYFRNEKTCFMYDTYQNIYKHKYCEIENMITMSRTFRSHLKRA